MPDPLCPMARVKHKKIPPAEFKSILHNLKERVDNSTRSFN
jgi:hypothetical protein